MALLRHSPNVYGWRREVVQDLESLLAAHPVPRFSLALAGGTTPGCIYPAMATLLRAKLLEPGWGTAKRKVTELHLVPGDERCGDIPEEQRNETLLRACFDSLASLPAVTFHHWPREQSPARVCDTMAAELVAAGALPLDLAYLGLGADLHTAGLFGEPLYRSDDQTCLYCVAPHEPHLRVSLAPQVFSHARHLRFLVRGSAKSQALALLLSGQGTGAAADILEARSLNPDLEPALILYCHE